MAVVATWVRAWLGWKRFHLERAMVRWQWRLLVRFWRRTCLFAYQVQYRLGCFEAVHAEALQGQEVPASSAINTLCSECGQPVPERA